MSGLVLALLAFIASHAVPATPPLRKALTARLGERAYLVLYSLLSLAMLTWVVLAYREAPFVALWRPEPFLRWIPALVMPVACVLLVAGLARPNPFSIGLSARGFDPERPGVLRLTRHPVPWALALWAGSHLAVRGDMAAMLLFGLFLALSLAGPILLDAKRKRLMGADWSRLGASTSRPSPAMFREMPWWHWAAGLVLYALLLHLHPWVIGVSPLP